MGLYDREWFWEGYEDRYGFKKKELKLQEKREKDQHSPKTYTHYCKYCNKLINLEIPSKELGPFFQYSFKCPHCGKKNNLGNDMSGIWLIIGIVAGIIILFLKIYFGN